MKSGLILVCCMTDISNMFLAECWRMETSSRLFYDFSNNIFLNLLAKRRIVTRSLYDRIDYGLKENEWNYDKNRGDVDWWCHDGTWN